MSLASRALAVPVVAALVLLGFWVGGAVISNDFETSMAATAVILGGVAFGLFAFTRGRPHLRLPVLGTFLVVSVVVGGVLAWNTFRDEEVNEQVVMGVAPSMAAQPPAGQNERPERPQHVELLSGRFESVAHPGEGRAAVVELASGERKLTLTEFETDNGPDLFVYLVAGPFADADDPDDFVNLGGLKGNKGNQQYEIPRNVDLDRYTNVTVWCRAFSVTFVKASLRPT